ncbi:zinc-binding alcohol dehydrogenase family protein [Streptomyces sp. Ag109_O5-1]|uniref:zinc-binding dehydrogenase n=1 Tax=Streptomyces sp. Ag109_O5-1 TaxID=1938851 RepID=UPI000F5128B4|nr:zinc-binding dehydrogenase [Streptomyces sp. Ag109_O5-1]RPE45135.1 zinc-binding alcohol dehydrogenase family protein [Streptomyces sp. Ag109_O5-1]
MKGISYSRYGGPGVLEYGEVRDPKIGPDAVLVKVRAAAVDPVDWKGREGHLDGVLKRLSALAEQGAVTVHVDGTFPLERTADAHRRSQEGRTRGNRW